MARYVRWTWCAGAAALVATICSAGPAMGAEIRIHDPAGQDIPFGPTPTTVPAMPSVGPNPSGYDMNFVDITFGAAGDTMQFGIHVFGTAGDADGDGDPDASTHPSFMSIDTPGVGFSENYTLFFDLDNDPGTGIGSAGYGFDLALTYGESDNLVFARDLTQAGALVTSGFSAAGSLSGSVATLTVVGWSGLVSQVVDNATPCEFAITGKAGSSFDGEPEDYLPPTEVDLCEHPVPEPTTLALCVLGVAGLWGRSRRPRSPRRRSGRW